MTLPRIEATGRLGNDPELKWTPSGAAVANFSIACDENKKDSNDNWEKVSTTWLRVAVWKDAAEAVAEHIKKGDLVTVIGQLTVRDYEHNSVNKQSVEVKNATVTKALPKVGGGGQSSSSNGWQQQNVQPLQQAPADPWSTHPAADQLPPF
jgi:single-strand DNA-binding protein